MKLAPLLLLSLSLSFLSFAKPSCHFPAMFNFGDSNSDTGSLSSAFAVGPINLPYGETFFKMPAGRFSDGRLIIDFIAERLCLPYVEAYLDALGGNFSHGANFATSRSTILIRTQHFHWVFIAHFRLAWSSNNFCYSKLGGMKKKKVPRKEYFSRALYTIDIGQNDLTAFFISSEKSPDNYFRSVLIQFSTVIKGIYKNGGRYFWIHNSGPLGCLGYVLILSTENFDQAGCSISYNNLAQKFNTLLNETIVQLRNELPYASLVLVDMYSVKYQLITHAHKYGFEKPLEACCGSGGNKYNYNTKARCGDSITINGVNVLLGKSCKNPQKRIIWDGIHYTEAANKWVFAQISTGRFSDPPIALTNACHKI
ncbi:hypothetical protein LUZ60_004383 [Juncus effusus]|nr:hypothetical protein LUZ60_004383 [Juncus effusus]